MRAAWIVLFTACGQGAIVAADGGVPDAGLPMAYAVCPTDVQPTFASLDARLFKVSCGTSGTACHSTAGAIYSGGLDLQGDAWAALVGVEANNIAGTARGLWRVRPRDSAQSFLRIKLATTRADDERYGSGMPFGAPGSVCPEVLQAVATWIEIGAQR